MSWSRVKKLQKPAKLLFKQRWLHLPRLPTVRAASSSAKRKPLNQSGGFLLSAKPRKPGDTWIRSSLGLSKCPQTVKSEKPPLGTPRFSTLTLPHLEEPLHLIWTIAIRCNKGTTCANDVNDGAKSSSSQKIDVTCGFLTKKKTGQTVLKRNRALARWRDRRIGMIVLTWQKKAKSTFYLRNLSKCGNNPAEFWKVVKSLKGITSSSLPQHVTLRLNKSNGFKHSLYLERSSVWPN